MPDQPRVILEKSRTVRLRYQRSNQRFQFTASQIARIEREQERERRAQKLRDKEKRRIQEKKKKAEKEAKARDERIRSGIPDPNAPSVPASQPLLFNFIKKTPSVQPESQDSKGGQVDTGSGNGSGSDTEVVTEFENENSSLEDEELNCMFIALGEAEVSTNANTEGRGPKDTGKDDDEFSECSAFYDEDIIKESGAALEEPVSVATVLSSDSFQDDTAILLEEFAPEFDPGTSFDQELAQLDAT